MSAIVVPVPEADPILDQVRARHPAAVQPVPAHVTVMYPFIPAPQLDDVTLAEVGAIFASTPPMEVSFARFARFPSLLYLAPTPAADFVRFTHAVTAHWPAYLPYGGAYDDVVPHLSVAHDLDAAAMDEMERDLAISVPVVARLVEAWLLVFEDPKWTVRARFSFGSAPGF